MKENNINDLIVIEQLPKITEKLQLISDEIEKEVQYALSLECNEDSKNEVKQERAKINKIKTDLEERRKAVKKAVLEPYEAFEGVYNDLVKDKLNNADNMLKSRIDTIEEQQKEAKEFELRNFANEWFNHYNINGFVPFERIGLNITLSASIKSLKDQIIEFCERVDKDLKLIDMEDYKEEIIIEYLETLDFTNSKLKVIERHKKIEELNGKNEQQEKIKEQEQQVVEKVEEVIKPPVELVEGKELLTVQFTIKDTRNNIKKVKTFLIENGIQYE